MASDYKVLPFETWKPSYDKEKTIKLAKPMAAKAYNPKDEQPPDMAWFRLNKQYIDSEIFGIFQKVMNRLVHGRPQDLELADLQVAAVGVKEVHFEQAKDVGIVGQQAMGKSLLINALLHRRNLSKTSAAGGACTASAIKYVHKPGMEDFGEVYDAAIQFMDDTELNEIISEHARRYYHFHFSNKVDPMYHDEEERAALTAESFFGLLWNAYNDEEAAEALRPLLLPAHIDNGALLREALKMAHRRMQEAGADEHRMKQFLDMGAAALMEETQNYIAQHESLPSLWPIVSHVRISMGSALLRNAVSIVDLPGMYCSLSAADQEY